MDVLSDRSDVRRRKLLFRSSHRGTQENDLILGRFAEASLAEFGTAQLDQFEALLDCTDPELFDWIVEGRTPPPQHDHEVLQTLRRFFTTPSRAHRHSRS